MALLMNGDQEIEEAGVGSFRRFDLVSGAVANSDHYFANTSGGKVKPNKKKLTDDSLDCFANSKSGVHKKIMKEWKLLGENLPDSIYVRVYEHRIDLLRAAIVGASGTPYHDGLFVFDLAFPSDYPARPPKVHYWSYGLQLNPNLYPNGTVCLSVLNTWYGSKTERWNPSGSTVLQVLLSIQALVLNSKPYFNEPGIGIIPGRAKRSAAYNENAFLLSCKTMLYLLRRPPKNFEELVAKHFRERAGTIFKACYAYIDGRVRVGFYSLNTTPVESPPPSRVHVSRDFVGSLRSVSQTLLEAFVQNGSSVDDLRQQVQAEKAEAKKNGWQRKKKEEKKKTSLGTLVIKKVSFGVGKIKKILGLHKAGEKKGAEEFDSTTTVV